MLIGTGMVGMSFAYTMLNCTGIDEMILVDVNQDKARGEAWTSTTVWCTPRPK